MPPRPRCRRYRVASPELYRQASQIHYAALNRSDVDLLAEAGVGQQRLHLLPNPVAADVETVTAAAKKEARQVLLESVGLPEEHRYLLYPVRGIRRKNLGELLLWSAVVRDTTFAVTLAPLNPAERSSYDCWVTLTKELALPVRFDVGRTIPFETNYAAADAIMTTSVAEGFGLVYLESTLSDRPLLGRELPGVTGDFRRSGMQFPGLSTQLLVPTHCFDTASALVRSCDLLSGLYEAYGLAEPTSMSTLLESQFASDTIDFAKLDRKSQASVIRAVQRDDQLRDAVRELNPVLEPGGRARRCAMGQCQRL